MKTIRNWLDEYGESHQNKINKFIHWICIPLIFWSIIALLSLIPFPTVFNSEDVFMEAFMHWGTVVIFLGLIFYLKLSFKIFLGMLFVSLGVLYSVEQLLLLDCVDDIILFYISMSVFVFSWILQFIGHKIEGKKPSFIKDIQFLLIGPAWLIGFIYNSLKIKY